MPRDGRVDGDSRRASRARALEEVRCRLIVEAARRSFETHGLDGSSMRLIAREAGCTTGAIYPYFASKEELYAALLSESLAALLAEVEAAITLAIVPLLRARGAIAALFDYYRDRPSELSLGLYLFHQPGPRASGLSRDLDRRLNAELMASVSVMEKAIAAAGFDDASMRAADGVSHAVGLLIMAATGRLKTFGGGADFMMARYLERLLPASSEPAA